MIFVAGRWTVSPLDYSTNSTTVISDFVIGWCNCGRCVSWTRVFLQLNAFPLSCSFSNPAKFWAVIYSSVLKYRNLIAQNDKIRNQIISELSRIQTFARNKCSSEVYLVNNNVCLIFRRPLLKKLGIASFKILKLKFRFLEFSLFGDSL